jgi:hypothetical protein
VNFAFGFNSFGPVDNKGVADTTAVGLWFPAAEGCVSGPSPAPSIMVVSFWTPKLIHGCEILLYGFRHIIEKLALIN